MYDWTEQLFKHEGVCIWNDDDAYDEMESWMENWVSLVTGDNIIGSVLLCHLFSHTHKKLIALLANRMYTA